MKYTLRRSVSLAVFTYGVLVLIGSSASALAQDGLPYTITPPEGAVSFGRVLASGSDADGDDLPDIFVGDPGVKRDGEWVGRWSMYSGRDGSLLWSVLGSEPHGGVFEPDASVTFIADLDGDGRDDVLLGLHEARQFAGVVQIYSGRTGELIRQYVGERGEDLGYDVARIGDLDGDHVDDFAYTGKLESRGLTYVRSGATADLLLAIDPPGDWSTRRLAGTGDLNGDHVPDLILATYQGGFGNFLTSRQFAVSGANGKALWQVIQPVGLVAGAGLAAGVDLTGDDVPDVALWVSSRDTIMILSGATGETVVSYLAPLPGTDWGRTLLFCDVNADGRPDLAAARYGSSFGIDVVNPLTGRVLHSIVGTGGDLNSADQIAMADVNGDGADDLIIGSGGNGVPVFGGSPLLLNFERRRDNYEVSVGEPYDFTVGGGTPGRTVHLLGSITGNGCTFVPQLGICIDLDQRIYRLGAAITDPKRVAHFTVQVPLNMPLGPVWLQALDVNDPGRGPITSNVMQLQVVQP
ncbi:MAG: VCBS repeat-containing protein [Phycisphaerales bacterium]|nr:VCBS repeat-containing protein [Phycisphaerales bacterium]